MLYKYRVAGKREGFRLSKEVRGRGQPKVNYRWCEGPRVKS